MRDFFTEWHFLQSRARLVPVILLSLSAHLLGLWFLWLNEQIEYGAIEKSERKGLTTSMLSVRFVSSERSALPTTARLTEKEAFVTVQDARTETIEAPSVSKQSPESDGLRDYFPTGRLTRLPFPLSHIDLNVSAIDEVAHEGAIELTIMVEVDGTVSRVLTSVEHDSASLYAERIAARFRSALFSPGEIDGKAVKSKAQITVVSEPLSQPGPKS